MSDPIYGSFMKFPLAVIREYHGYSIEEAARKMRIHPFRLKLIEKHPGRASLSTAKKLKKLYKFRLDDIYFGSVADCIAFNRSLSSQANTPSG